MEINEETNNEKSCKQSDKQQEMLSYGYWLHNIPGVGNKTILELLEQIGNEKDIFEASEKKLQPFITSRQLKAFELSRKNWKPEEEYKKLAKRNISFVTITNPNYPKKLSNIPDAPYGIYVKGKLPKDEIPSVAIVGARTCSEYGRYMAAQFAASLAFSNIQVISGMARGIDGIGQRAALEAGGSTFGVMGSGVDVCYPEENILLYQNIIKSRKGGIISEFPPGTDPKPSFFPMRNRIISGLADVILVIEAKEKSGTLITVDMALEQGREVYALPGRVSDELSFGCNRLIKQGAGIAISPEDFIQELFMVSTSDIKGRNKTGRKQNFSTLENIILQSLELGPESLDSIFHKIISSETMEAREYTLPQIIEGLMELCIKGIVMQENGSYIIIQHTV